MEKKTRRKFIATAVAAGMAPAAMAYNPGSEKKYLVHHVFFWLKKPGSENDRKLLIEGLQTLGKIEQVKKLLIGVPADTEKREVVDNSFDVSELMYFENAADQLTYQKHPIHLKFIENCSHLWGRVLVYDMVEV